MSNKDFKFVVRGSDFSILSNEAVRLAKRAAGNVPQSGIRKLGTDAYLLQSNTMRDIPDCVRNGGWAHSSSALIKKGMKVFIIPSNKVEAEYGSAALGVSFTATEDMHKDNDNKFVWASEK